MILLIGSDSVTAQKIDPGTFISLDMWERRHIQQWVRTAPEVLGEELLIVSEEFDRFEGSRDRLDLLALDRNGNLVVIELKRDSAAGYADLQAVRYAAMVSAMTLDDLVPYYLAYRAKYCPSEELSPDDARSQLESFVAAEEFDELSNRPRIILCSEGFSQELTTTVLWLREFKLDVTCVRITPYKIGSQVAIVPTRIIPLQEARQYLVQVQQKQEREKQQQVTGSRRARSMRVLAENGLITAGERIFLRHGLPEYMSYDPDNPMYHATITGKLGQQNTIRWEHDGLEYSISGLTWNIFRDLHPKKKNPSGINGPWYWTNAEGTALWFLAENHVRPTTAAAEHPLAGNTAPAKPLNPDSSAGLLPRH